MNTPSPLASFFGPPVSIYTRAQAIDDGVLVDVTAQARETGFRCPVAITEAAWQAWCEWTEQDTERQVYQDTRGRVHDVLWMAYCGTRSAAGGERLPFQFMAVARDGRAQRARLQTLHVIAGPGDDGELVLTIMQPDED
jgi:hypothetical protein